MNTISRTFDLLPYYESNYSPEKVLSYKENGSWQHVDIKTYRDQVDRFSLGLLDLGFKKGDKIASICNNRPEWSFIDFGMSQIGCVQVAIYPTIAPIEFEHILQHSDARILIISTQELYDKILPIASKLKNIEKIYTIDPVNACSNWKEIQYQDEITPAKTEKLENAKAGVRPEDLLTLIYTSGTTGLSKGVMLSHNNVVSNVKIARQFTPYLNPGDRALSFLPLSHVLERVGLYLWHFVGLKIHFAESLESIGDNMREIKVSTFITVPRVFEKVYDKIINKGRTLKGIKKMLFFWAVQLGNKYDPNPENRSSLYNLKLKLANKLIFSKWREALGGELKGVISGGAPLQPRLARVFMAAGIGVQEGYGLTETSPLISANQSFHPYVKIGSVGKVPEGIEVKIAEDGEIIARGENVMKGYYKDEAMTREVLTRDGWFHTGDIGHLDEDGFLFITDRKKEIFKLSGGKYVAPQLVENKMKESMFIDQLIVLGESEKFTSAIIVPDFEFLHNWCSIHQVNFHDNHQLITIDQVKSRIEKEIKVLNEELGWVEQIKEFKLVCDEWTPENGLLSPTQKLKRKKVMKKYDDLIKNIYQN